MGRGGKDTTLANRRQELACKLLEGDSPDWGAVEFLVRGSAGADDRWGRIPRALMGAFVRESEKPGFLIDDDILSLLITMEGEERFRTVEGRGLDRLRLAAVALDHDLSFTRWLIGNRAWAMEGTNAIALRGLLAGRADGLPTPAMTVLEFLLDSGRLGDEVKALMTLAGNGYGALAARICETRGIDTGKMVAGGKPLAEFVAMDAMATDADWDWVAGRDLPSRAKVGGLLAATFERGPERVLPLVLSKAEAMERVVPATAIVERVRFLGGTARELLRVVEAVLGAGGRFEGDGHGALLHALSISCPPQGEKDVSSLASCLRGMGMVEGVGGGGFRGLLDLMSRNALWPDQSLTLLEALLSCGADPMADMGDGRGSMMQTLRKRGYGKITDGLLAMVEEMELERSTGDVSSRATRRKL